VSRGTKTLGPRLSPNPGTLSVSNPMILNPKHSLTLFLSYNLQVMTKSTNKLNPN